MYNEWLCPYPGINHGKKIMNRKSQNFIVNYEILEYFIIIFALFLFLTFFFFICLGVYFGLFWYLFKTLIENQIVSGIGCQVFHGISGFWVLDACIVSLGGWLCGCPGTGFSFWSVVLRRPLPPVLDRLTHFHHWLVFLVGCLLYMYHW